MRSQSVKTIAATDVGYDVNKKIEGGKRYMAADTDRRLLAVNLTRANVVDLTSVQLVLDGLQ